MPKVQDMYVTDVKCKLLCHLLQYIITYFCHLTKNRVFLRYWYLSAFQNEAYVEVGLIK